MAAGSSGHYLIDCNPQVGKEMRDVHHFLVLSPAIFNDKTSLVIGLPMTTATYMRITPLPWRWVRLQSDRLNKPALYYVINLNLSTGECVVQSFIH